MRLNDWDWRREQEEACRLFDFGGRTVTDKWRPWYEASGKVAEYCDTDIIATKSLFDHFQAEYGAKTFENKEDTKMNITQGVRDEQAKDNVRRNLMNKLKVGDTIYTSTNVNTPMEITAFDYKYYRIQVKSCRYEEGFETKRWFWIDPLTITSPILNNKEDTKMDLNQLTDNKQAADAQRRNIMNKLKVGDKICTSINMTTPMEIFAFDYAHLRVGLMNRISLEGYEKVSRIWVDPLAIINLPVRKVSYADYYAEKRKQKKVGYIPTPKKIIINEDSKVTVVMWDDNTKTIVKCSEADQYDPYAAYCAAFAKKCYGTNSQLKKTIENHTVFQESKKKNKTDAPLLPSMEEAAKNFCDTAKSFCDTAKKYFGTD